MRNPITLTHAQLTGLVQQIQHELFYVGTVYPSNNAAGYELFALHNGSYPGHVVDKLRQLMQLAGIAPSNRSETRDDGMPPQPSLSPAPWVDWYDRDNEGRITQAGVDTADRASNICITCCENIEIDDPVEFNTIVERDTKLLAAAPALANACIAAAIWLREYDMQNVDDGLADLRRQLDQAIEQAGGFPIVAT